MQRVQALSALQEKISLDYNSRLVGTAQPVLVEGVSDESDLLLQARLASQAPEVDGCVFINKGFGKVGEIVVARITEAHPHDLIAEIDESANPSSKYGHQ